MNIKNGDKNKMPMHTGFSLTLEFIFSIGIVIFSTGSGWFLIKRSEKDVNEIREDLKGVKIELNDMRRSIDVHSEKINHVNEKMFIFGGQIEKVLKILTDKIPISISSKK